MHNKDAQFLRNHVGFVLGMTDTTVRLNAIGSALIYMQNNYGYCSEVLFRGSFIPAPVTLISNINDTCGPFSGLGCSLRS